MHVSDFSNWFERPAHHRCASKNCFQPPICEWTDKTAGMMGLMTVSGKQLQQS